jgi:uncharacterized protein YggE
MATVTVRGEAVADVPPDRVRLLVVVQAEAATAAEALALLADRAAAAGRVLDAAGELVLLRRPSTVAVQPTWSPTGEVSGQAARQSTTVETRPGGPLGELLARLTAVPGATLESTGWVVDPGNPAHGRLRAAAVADARARATDYARAADLRLGAVEWIAEPGTVHPPEPRGVARTAALESASYGSVLELRSEPIIVAAAVEVRYGLLPGPGT